MSDALITQDYWDQQADEYTQQEALTGVKTFSTQGGTLSLGEDDMPGNMIAVVVLDAIMENTYYETRFDEDDPTPPTCFAMGRDPKTMGPPLDHMEETDPDVKFFDPPSEKCAGCPMNEWGSSDRGRGKACQNRRRLAVIPAGEFIKRRGSRDLDLELFDDKGHFADADMAYLKVPVTSAKAWSKYVHQLSKSVRRPPYGVVTIISLVPDKKSQFCMEFEMEEEIPDHLVPTIIERHKDAMDNIIRYYTPPDAEDQRGNDGLRKVKRTKKIGR